MINNIIIIKNKNKLMNYQKLNEKKEYKKHIPLKKLFIKMVFGVKKIFYDYI